MISPIFWTPICQVIATLTMSNPRGAGGRDDVESIGDRGGAAPVSMARSGLGQQSARRIIGAGLPRRARDVADEELMVRAIGVAKRTPKGDVPVGALVVAPDGEVLGEGFNQREQCADPLGHAEIMAIRAATARYGDEWRLTDCTLVVTLEPCAMCAGAAVGARIGRIVFGTWEPRTGACGSVWDVPRESPLHKAQVTGGVLQAECDALLRGFFEELR